MVSLAPFVTYTLPLSRYVLPVVKVVLALITCGNVITAKVALDADPADNPSSRFLISFLHDATSIAIAVTGSNNLFICFFVISNRKIKI